MTAQPIPRQERHHEFEGMIASDPSMLRLFETITRAAPLDEPVLIHGESGVGKELVARALHRRSGRGGALVAINVAALAGDLVESELFGSVRGAFTGATDRVGLLETVRGGTLYLDEAGDLPPTVQAKLLRVLEGRTVRRLGSTAERAVSFRLVLSVQESVESLVSTGRWRPDFRYRVERLTLDIPPLRDRPGDVPILAAGIGARYGAALDRGGFAALERHWWPGNVRELEAVVSRAAFAAHGCVVTARHVMDAISTCGAAEPPARWERSLEVVEREHIELVLRRTGYDVEQAGTVLGMSRSALYRKVAVYGIGLRRRAPAGRIAHEPGGAAPD